MEPLDLCKSLHSCKKFASVFCMYYIVVIYMGFVLIFLLGQARPMQGTNTRRGPFIGGAIATDIDHL